MAKFISHSALSDCLPTSFMPYVNAALPVQNKLFI